MSDSFPTEDGTISEINDQTVIHALLNLENDQSFEPVLSQHNGTTHKEGNHYAIQPMTHAQTGTGTLSYHQTDYHAFNKTMQENAAFQNQGNQSIEGKADGKAVQQRMPGEWNYNDQSVPLSFQQQDATAQESRQEYHEQNFCSFPNLTGTTFPHTDFQSFVDDNSLYMEIVTARDGEYTNQAINEFAQQITGESKGEFFGFALV